jgi:hypothetical protein
MASGHETDHPDLAFHPGRKVSREDHDARVQQSRVTGPGLQAGTIDPRLGSLERRMLEAGL